MAPSIKAARLQTCADSFAAAWASIQQQVQPALNKDTSAAAGAGPADAVNGNPAPTVKATWSNLKALVADSKVKLSQVRQRCAEQLPQCPNVGRKVAEWLDSTLDESLQGLLGSSDVVATPTAPSPDTYPEVTCE